MYRLYWKMTIYGHFSISSSHYGIHLLTVFSISSIHFGIHLLTVLYPKPCYNKPCYKEVVVLIILTPICSLSFIYINVMFVYVFETIIQTNMCYMGTDTFNRVNSVRTVLSPFWKGAYPKREGFAPIWSKFFPFGLDPFQKGLSVQKSISQKVAPVVTYSSMYAIFPF